MKPIRNELKQQTEPNKMSYSDTEDNFPDEDENEYSDFELDIENLTPPKIKKNCVQDED